VPSKSSLNLIVEITEGFGLSSEVILEALGRPAVLVLKQKEADRILALHVQSLSSVGGCGITARMMCPSMMIMMPCSLSRTSDFI